MMWRVAPRVRLSVIAVLALVGFSMPTLVPGRALAVSEERTYRVVDVARDDVLNVRSGPSAGYPVIAEIPPTGRGLRLNGPCRGWCSITYNGATGWVHARYLAVEPSVAPFVQRTPTPEQLRNPPNLPAYWSVTGTTRDGLRVHGEPSPSAPVVHVFEAEASCIRLAGGCQKPWCQVKFPTGSGERVGWVDSNKLAPSEGRCGR
jgi:uncharacterized protein YraI